MTMAPSGRRCVGWCSRRDEQYLFTEPRGAWLERVARKLYEARQQQPSNQAFAIWLIENDLVVPEDQSRLTSVGKTESNSPNDPVSPSVARPIAESDDTQHASPVVSSEKIDPTPEVFRELRRQIREAGGEAP